MRFGSFAILTICGFLVFALTMTFVPILPTWVNNSARLGLLALLAILWKTSQNGSRLQRFRPVFFAYFAAVSALRLAISSATGG